MVCAPCTVALLIREWQVTETKRGIVLKIKKGGNEELNVLARQARTGLMCCHFLSEFYLTFLCYCASERARLCVAGSFWLSVWGFSLQESRLTCMLVGLQVCQGLDKYFSFYIQ